MKVQFVLVVTILSILTILSCRKDSDITTTEEYTLSSVNGFITNEENNAVSQAEVIINGIKFITDEFGYFNAEQVAHNGRILIKVNKSGYFEGSRTIFTRSNEKSFVKVSLIKETFPYKLNSLVGGTILMEDLVKLEFPPNAIVDKNGNNYDGIVLIGIKYLDPTLSTTFDEMPGALIGQNQNLEDVALESYGMAGFWLRDLNGNSLNIKNGEKCKMTLKIPEKMVSYAPNIMPLWHFDESKGIWIEEGAASRNGNYYEGDVSHFSFWNCDYPRPLVYIKGKLKDQNGNPTEGIVSIFIEGRNDQCRTYTNAAGEFEGLFPANEPLILEVIDFCNTTILSRELGFLTTDQDLGDIQVQIANTTESISLSGTVLGCDGLLSPDAIVAVISNGKRTDYTADQEGKFSFNIYKCNATLFEIKAISVKDEKESLTISMLPTSNLSNLILNACDNDIEEYARISLSNGEKINFFYNLYYIENYGVWCEPISESIRATFYVDIFDKNVVENLPLSSGIDYFKINHFFFKAEGKNNGTAIFSKFVSDKNDISSINEGTFQMKTVKKGVYNGFSYPITETDLTATGEFRYKND